MMTGIVVIMVMMRTTMMTPMDGYDMSMVVLMTVLWRSDDVSGDNYY